MANLLVVHTSPNPNQSHTRDLADTYVKQWLSNNPEGQVVIRDVGVNPPPHLSLDAINGFYTAEEERSAEAKDAVALSDELVAELQQADTIVIGAPMHNFSIPSSLKAWIDHVCRVGLTFRYTSSGPVGLLQGKSVVVISARGGNYRDGAPAAAMNYLNPYMETVLGFIGLNDVRFINAESTASSDEGKKEAEQAIVQLTAA